MRVAVTGATGFLGRHVMAALLGSGYDAAPYHVTANAPQFDGFDAVIHCAAACGGIGYNRANGYELMRTNLALNQAVVDACVAAKTRLVAIGSVCAYPSNAPLPFREESLWDGYPEPTCAPYGIAKRVLVEQCKQAARYDGLSCTALIPTNMYGPGDEYFERSHVIPAIIRKLSEATDTVTIWGDGTPTRDFLYVEDCADACIRALTCDEFGPINIATEREVMIADLVDMVAEMIGFRGRIEWDVTQPNGQPRRCVCAEKARLLLGWSASTSLRDGLAATVADWKRRCRER